MLNRMKRGAGSCGDAQRSVLSVNELKKTSARKNQPVEKVFLLGEEMRESLVVSEEFSSYI